MMQYSESSELYPPQPKENDDAAQSNIASSSLDFIKLLSSNQPLPAESDRSAIKKHNFPQLDMALIEFEAPKWEQTDTSPKTQPEQRLKTLSSGIDKELAANIDQLTKKLNADDFGERQDASHALEQLLTNNGTAAFAYVAKAGTEAKDLETKERIERLISPLISKELSTPSFGQWLNGQKGLEGGVNTDVPEILKSMVQGTEQQKNRQDRLEVLSAYLDASKSPLSEDMNVRLNECKCTKEIADELMQCKNVELNATSDSGLAALAKLAPNVQTLHITDSPNITDKGLASIANFPVLKDLELNDIAVGKEGLHGIALAPSLDSLSIVSGELTNEKLSALANCTNLRSLNITDNPAVTDGALRHLQGLKDLESLVLDRTGITSKLLDNMPSLASLHMLSIKGTELSTHGLDAQKITERMSNLAEIIIGDNLSGAKLKQLNSQLEGRVVVNRQYNH